jgi:hypothetical protein
MEFNNNLYKRQFILGPGFVDKLEGWNKIKINEDYFLTTHPCLETNSVKCGFLSLTMLGFALDYENPGYNNIEILYKLINRVKKTDDIFEFSAKLCGRYIIIFDNGSEPVIFNDTVGLRQIVYYKNNSNQYWCASQAGIIADLFGMRPDKKYLNDFFYNKEIIQNLTQWWPGDHTGFTEIRQLLPNHYLNLKTGKTIRFWPLQKDKIKQSPVNESAERASGILKSIMNSANKRFELAQGFTAGFDSRILLAASKDFLKNTIFFTKKNISLNKDSNDMKIPCIIASKLAIDYRVFKCDSKKINEELKEIFIFNTTPSRFNELDQLRILEVQSLFNAWPAKKVFVTGAYDGITKSHYNFKSKKLTPEVLASLAHMGGNKIAIKLFSDWLREEGVAIENTGYSILDIFYWEQRAGRWEAMLALEYDLVHETFAPFNCRELLTTILAVKAKYRRFPYYRFHRLLIKNLWPELLFFPINPVGKRFTIKKIVKDRIFNTDLGFLLLKKTRELFKKSQKRY